MAVIAVCMAWTKAGLKLWWHTGNRGVDMDSGKNPIMLTQKAMEHK